MGTQRLCRNHQLDHSSCHPVFGPRALDSPILSLILGPPELCDHPSTSCAIQAVQPQPERNRNIGIGCGGSVTGYRLCEPRGRAREKVGRWGRHFLPGPPRCHLCPTQGQGHRSRVVSGGSPKDCHTHCSWYIESCSRWRPVSTTSIAPCHNSRAAEPREGYTLRASCSRNLVSVDQDHRVKGPHSLQR